MLKNLTIQATAVAHCSIEVEAENEEEAINLAMNNKNKQDWYVEELVEYNDCEIVR